MTKQTSTNAFGSLNGLQYSTPAIEASRHLHYDHTSPTGLRWFDTGPGRSIDRVAGGPARDGYWRVGGKCLGSHQVPAHRLIWEMTYGPIPDGLVIDHIDGNPANNRLDNLRLSTTRLNAYNAKARNGRYLPKGLYISACGRCTVIVKGEAHGLTFNIDDDTTGELLNAACETARLVTLALHGEFANVTDHYCQLPIEAVYGDAEGDPWVK